jgi:hypothetical protein
MKKVIMMASVLLCVVGLQAEVSDSVSTAEAKAISDGKVKGEAAAKAAVEEANSKEEFKSKQDGENFKKEAEADAKKLTAKEADKK